MNKDHDHGMHCCRCRRRRRGKEQMVWYLSVEDGGTSSKIGEKQEKQFLHFRHSPPSICAAIGCAPALAQQSSE